MLPRAFLLGTLLALMIAACSGDSVTTAVFDNCTPGSVRSCVGPDGCTGDQVCEPDGAGYRLCDCRSSTAAGTGGGANASTSTGQGAGTTNGSGAGGSGAGGMGGASTSTGNGGSGGAPVGCDAEPSCVDCATCTQNADCAAAWAACDQACLDATACLAQCEGFCGNDQSCYDDCAVNANDSCANQFPAGEPLAQALQSCTCGACPNACAGVTTCGALTPPQCDEGGYTAGNNPLAQHYGTMLEVQIPQLGQNGIDLMLIELHYADGASDNPRTVQLSGENFATCVDCLRIRSHVGGTYYLAQSGTMEIVANGDVGDTFTVTLTDVVLAEVTINATTRQSTLVQGGKRWCIGSFTTSVPINAGTGQCTTPPNDPLFDCNPASNGCTNPCEVVSQCGCAPGANCVLDLNNNNEVCINAGNAGTGDACMNTIDCAAGHECLTSNMVESCYRYCNSNADCPGTGACEITVMGTSQQWCTLSCNPLNGTGCPTSLACEIDDGPPAFTFCRPEGSGTQGAVCMNGNSCDDGYTCVTVNNAPNPTCQRWCRVSNPACPTGSTCVGFGTPVVVGGNEYGACI